MIIYFFSNYDNDNVNSFIINENDTDIKLISKVDDSENIINYLRHHILYTDDKFNIIYFDEPIYVKFKYRNETYQICLKKLEATKDDHLEIVTTPKYLSAVVNGEVDLTETIQEFHGNTKNFFKHIPDTVHELPLILKKYSGKLETFDMMGNSQVHHI